MGDFQNPRRDARERKREGEPSQTTQRERTDQHALRSKQLLFQVLPVLRRRHRAKGQGEGGREEGRRREGGRRVIEANRPTKSAARWMRTARPARPGAVLNNQDRCVDKQLLLNTLRFF